MSQIQINLPEDTTKKLRILAAKADRSLTKFIPLYLNYAIDLNIIDVDERTGSFTNPNHSTSASKSASNLTLEQLKEAGLSSFKLEKEPSTDEQILAQQKLELTQQKLDLEKEKIKNKRSDFLKEQSEKILGYPLPYLTDQYITDYVLNEYPTNEEITAYLTKLQEEGYEIEDSYKYSQEISEYEEAINITDEYKKIKAYCIAHGLSHDLLDLLQYPSSIQIENHDELIKSALLTPLDHTYSEEEQNALAECFKPKEA